ncbi:MAG: iron ABC transporter permease [Gemmatales bacterium]|nr:iron ABC transporter permease [Gemmatales bacterium]MDW8386851.1 iron ABC transporter permease [Gemmatales bacterium]
MNRLMIWLRSQWVPFILLAFLGFFLLYPIAYVVPSATHFQQTVLDPGGRPILKDGQPVREDVWTLYFFQLLATNPFLWRCFINSLFIATLTTVLTTLLSLPLAYWFTRLRFPGQTVLAGLLLVPLILPPFVGALGMERLLNPYGTINLLLMDLGLMDPQRPFDWLAEAGLLGVVVLEVLHLYPIMYLNVAAALANIDPTLEDAARNLGASEWRIFRTVTFPLMLPGYFAGATLVFVWAFTDLGTPLIFNFSQVLSVQIFNQISEAQTNPLGYALVVTTMLVTLTLFYLSRLFLGRQGQYVMMSRGGVGSRVQQPRGTSLIGIYLFVGLLGFVSALPHLGVVLMSVTGRWSFTPLPTEFSSEAYRLVLSERLAYTSITNSLYYSLASTTLDLVLGFAIAYWVVRRPGRLAAFLDGLTMLPLALPGLVLAFGYLTCYSRMTLFGWEFGKWLDPANNPTLLLIVAYAVRRLPYVARAAMAGLMQIPPALEEAAENLGASPWRTLRTVTLPLLSASLIAGGILAFAFAMLEVSDSLMLAQQERYMPITRAIFGFWLRPDDGPYIASAMGTIGMGILVISLVLASAVLGRRMGELFRA